MIRRFGKIYQYTATGEGTVPVTGVFENPIRQSQIGQRPVSARFPMISLLRSQVPNLTKGDLFDIDGVDYRCKEPGDDEGEIVTAKLEVLR